MAWRDELGEITQHGYDASVLRRITFLGATGTVTGSRFLVNHGSGTTLVDCGLFQGPRSMRDRNWEPFPVDPAGIDRVVLTHAHIDHTGFLPRLVKDGYRGPVWATPATCDLLKLLLPDGGHLQEEEARWHNRHRTTHHQPALPLFTEEDARQSLKLLKPKPYDDVLDLGEGIGVRFLRAGHILGSAMIEFRLPLDGPQSTILFTGDLGRQGRPILKDPALVKHAGTLILESTYGGRHHEQVDPAQTLKEIINRTARLGGVVLIPAFAIGRTQLVLYLINELQRADLIPRLPIFVDSPMASSAVPMHRDHIEEHDLDMRALTAEEGCPITPPNLRMTRSVEESKDLNNLTMPAIIISASGMATGGRVVHHLRNRLDDSRNAVVFVGYQAQGTRGRMIQDGAREVSIYGHKVTVRAAIHTVTGLSAHADEEETLAWLENFDYAPRRTYLVHGEPEASQALAEAIRARLGWEVSIPEYGDAVDV